MPQSVAADAAKGDDVVWNLKVDTDGKPLKDTKGFPIFVKEDNSEIALDVEETYKNVGRLIGEAKTHREAKETAEAANEAFKGLDPAEVKKALQTVKDLSGKEVIDAGKLDAVRADTVRLMEEKFKPVTDENAKLKANNEKSTIATAFANSEFIKSKIADNVPRDMLQATFGNHFKIDGDKIVAKPNGSDTLMSPSNPAVPATFDEAFEVIVNAYPGKANILKGTGANGSGGTGRQGGTGGFNGGGKPTLTRDAWQALPPVERSAAVATHIITD